MIRYEEFREVPSEEFRFRAVRAVRGVRAVNRPLRNHVERLTRSLGKARHVARCEYLPDEFPSGSLLSTRRGIVRDAAEIPERLAKRRAASLSHCNFGAPGSRREDAAGS